jgi:O-antigen ligase
MNHGSKKYNLNKIIEYGLYLFVFLLPWQARIFLKSGEINGEYFEYLTYSLYAVDIALFLLIAVFFISRFAVSIKNRENFGQIPVIYWLMGGLELTLFISIFFARDTGLAFYNYLVFLLAIGIFWILDKAEYSKKKLFYAFFATVFLQSCLAIWQFFAQNVFSSKYLGMAGADPSVLGVSVIEAFGPDGSAIRWLRAYGSLDHPNILGGFLALALLMLVAFYLKNFEQGKDLKIKASKKYLIMTVYLFSLVALIFSFSRSGWLGFLSGLAVLIAFVIFKKKYFQLKKILQIIILSLFLFAVAYSQYSFLFHARLSANSRLENKSIAERMESLEYSIPIIQRNFWGTGAGNYSLALKDKFPDQPGWHYQPVHNTYLLVWAEIGLFGILFFLGILFYILRRAWKQKNFYIFSIISALAIMLLFDHWWWSLHFGMYFLWFVLGVVYRELKNT